MQLLVLKIVVLQSLVIALLLRISVTMLNLEDHLSLVLVTTRLNTLVSVLVTTLLVSQHVRKSS